MENINPQIIDQQRAFLIKKLSHALRAPDLQNEEKQEFNDKLRLLIKEIENRNLEKLG